MRQALMREFMMSIDDLIGKATGIISAIAAAPREERDNLPSSGFGEDYNKLRDAAMKLMPAKADLFPPAVGCDDTRGVSLVRYLEIHAYALQISQLLASAE